MRRRANGQLIEILSELDCSGTKGVPRVAKNTFNRADGRRETEDGCHAKCAGGCQMRKQRL